MAGRRYRSSGGGSGSLIEMVSAPDVDRSEKPTDATSTRAMTSNDSYVGMWYQSWMIILMPTNARMIARPCCR